MKKMEEGSAEVEMEFAGGGGESNQGAAIHLKQLLSLTQAIASQRGVASGVGEGSTWC